MEQEQAMAVLNKVAVQNGVSLDVVLEEIEAIIEGGINSHDMQIRRRWEAIPREGDAPTVEELMIYLVNEVHKRGAS